MDIKRIDVYDDVRFSRTALLEHGAYLVDGEPYEFEIVARDAAVVRGPDKAKYCELIEEFRFHAPQITVFTDGSGAPVANYPPCERFMVELSSIQPSQFLVDETKLSAVGSFIRSPEDVVVQVLKWGDRWVALDGHTRLCFAARLGFRSVYAVISEGFDPLWVFVVEAQRRGVRSPSDLPVVSHAEYLRVWDGYCDSVFCAQAEQNTNQN